MTDKAEKSVVFPALWLAAENQRIAAIEATRNFFEKMGTATRLSAYGLDGSSIPALLVKLEEKGMTKHITFARTS